MTPVPAVRCSSCKFQWNSAAMADGLRLHGSCIKCGGELVFADAEQPEPRPAEAEERFTPGETAPHLVLGIPRR